MQITLHVLWGSWQTNVKLNWTISSALDADLVTTNLLSQRKGLKYYTIGFSQPSFLVEQNF